MTLQAIICLEDGSKRVVVDGVEMDSTAADLGAEDWAAVDAAGQVPLSEEQLVAKYEASLDVMLDSVAQQYRYADRTRLALRASYPNSHQALAQAFGTWMDSCNDLAKQCYIDVKAGSRPLPTHDEFMAMFPEFEP